MKLVYSQQNLKCNFLIDFKFDKYMFFFQKMKNFPWIYFSIIFFLVLGYKILR